MKITILGCGCAPGLPMIGQMWGECDPMEPRNRRLRPSILVQENEISLLVDTSPDLRQQALMADIRYLTAVLYTHAHADHTHGIDDLRSVNWLMQQALPIYADPVTLAEIKTRFGYIFHNPPSGHQIYKPSLEPHELTEPLHFGSIKVNFFMQTHGRTHSIGYRFNDFAYSTDVNALDDHALRMLEGVKIWVVDCARETPHKTHSHLPQTLEWIERVRPERAILTHMDHSMDYQSLCAKLPQGVEPAYDGLVLEL